VPISKWLLAIHLLASSKKGMSAHQLHRMLGVTYRAAWFMAHRLRHAMADDGTFPMSGTVEADETYVGGKRRMGGRSRIATGKTGRPGPNDSNKTPVLALVERKGRAVAFPIERVDGRMIQDAIRSRTRPKVTHIMSDEYKSYHGLDMGFAAHSAIEHKTEYVSKDGDTHTNTVEGFFSLLKRGIMGTFHHVSKGHLHRYCDEFAFRYSHRIALGWDDEQRTKQIMLAAEGKRLTFKQPSGASAA
jgi:hypothetical protein